MVSERPGESDGPPTREEIEAFARDWYRKLDEHVAVAELLPMLDADVEFHIPEGVRRGLDGFRELYEGPGGWIRSFFDETHTLSEVSVSWREGVAFTRIVVNWQARRWRPPAPRSEWIGFDVNQEWNVKRHGATGRRVMTRYVVNELRPMPGSPPL
jgi:hypothetical protein